MAGNITVKKNDDTTDVIYVQKATSGGDTGIALWRQDAHAAPYTGLKPEFRLGSKFNGPRTARRVNVQFVYKSYATDSTTGVSSLTGQVPITVTAAIPLNIAQADVDEAISQLFNLLDHVDVKGYFKTGYAP
jgi:hypothetical protein